MLKQLTTGCFIGAVLLSNALIVHGEEMPEPEAEAIWKYINQENPFTEWAFWSDHQGTDDSTAHAPKHKIYTNEQAITSETPPMKNGAMLVKYNLTPADEVKAVSVMYKVKDYNPTAGDWFWAEYKPTGEVVMSGKGEKCLSCHNAEADNDYILGHDFEGLPKAEAKAVWKYITQDNPFTEWAFWSDHQGTSDSATLHSPKHKIYTNKEAQESTAPPLQDGSMLVQYILTPADEIQAVAVMYKVKGYNPDAGDWFWGKYTPTGEVEAAGKVERCIACHTDKADNDYIKMHEFDK